MVLYPDFPPSITVFLIFFALFSAIVRFGVREPVAPELVHVTLALWPVCAAGILLSFAGQMMRPWLLGINRSDLGLNGSAIAHWGGALTIWLLLVILSVRSYWRWRRAMFQVGPVRDRIIDPVTGDSIDYDILVYGTKPGHATVVFVGENREFMAMTYGLDDESEARYDQLCRMAAARCYQLGVLRPAAQRGVVHIDLPGGMPWPYANLHP